MRMTDIAKGRDYVVASSFDWGRVWQWPPERTQALRYRVLLTGTKPKVHGGAPRVMVAPVGPDGEHARDGNGRPLDTVNVLPSMVRMPWAVFQEQHRVRSEARHHRNAAEHMLQARHLARVRELCPGYDRELGSKPRLTLGELVDLLEQAFHTGLQAGGARHE